MTPSWEVLVGDCREVLRTLPEQSVHTVVTSPPYFGLRDYGTGEWEGGEADCAHRVGGQVADSKAKGAITAGMRPGTDASCCKDCGARRVDQQIGLEATPAEFVAAIVEVFREVHRVLRDDGTVWLNLGDSYAATGGHNREGTTSQRVGRANLRQQNRGTTFVPAGLKPKDLMMIPARVAIALCDDGWYLRSDIVWSKPNPMPESVGDRPTRAHEFIFLLSKQPRYFYDADAIREGYATGSIDRIEAGFKDRYSEVASGGFRGSYGGPNGEQVNPAGRNKRDVWTVTTKPYSDAHFATFPPDLIEPCVLAGAPEKACAECGAPWVAIVEKAPSAWPERKAAGATWGNVENPAANGGTARVVHGQGVSRDLTRSSRRVGEEPSCECGAATVPGVVLDPFNGAGTTGLVAVRTGRAYIGIELNAEYAQLARDRIATDIRLGHRSPQRVPDQPDAQDVLDLFGASS